MRVACKTCGAAYAVADEKVRGRTFKSRCKKCGEWIVVVGNADGLEASMHSQPAKPQAAREPAGTVNPVTTAPLAPQKPNAAQPTLSGKLRESAPKTSRPTEGISPGSSSLHGLPTSPPRSLAPPGLSSSSPSMEPAARPTSPAKPLRSSSLPSSPLSLPPPLVRPSPFALLVTSGVDQGKTFPVLLDREVVLGASKKADISLGDTVASRRHASLRVISGRLQVTDLESTNGTFVNGTRVVTQMVDLGDQVLIGLTVLQVVEASPSDSAMGRMPSPPQPLARHFRLRVLSGPDKGAEHDVPSDRPITAGASKKVDITITDEVMSRRHIQLSVTAAGLTIEDLGSTNGTYVNSERITSPVTLLADDRILIGKTIIQILEM